jgi:hypothetical protein
MKDLKKIKTVLMIELLDFFSKDNEFIYNEENKWNIYQDVSYNVLFLSQNNNDLNVIIKAKCIMEVLKDFNVDDQFKEIKIYNVINPELKLNQNTILS